MNRIKIYEGTDDFHFIYFKHENSNTHELLYHPNDFYKEYFTWTPTSGGADLKEKSRDLEDWEVVKFKLEGKIKC